jgi:hypothetical protein
MAPRMKFTLLVLATCIAVSAGIAAIEFPGRVRYDAGFVQPSADLQRMQTEIAEMANTLRRLAVADSVQHLLAASNKQIVAVHDSSPRLSAEIATQMRKVGEHHARIAVLFLPAGFSARTPAGAIDPPGAEFVFGGAPGAPWCAAAHYRAGQDWKPEPGDERRVFGPCVFWARYGAPGPAVQAWLLSGGYGFADSPENYAVDEEVRVRRSVFGIRRGWYMEPFAGERCLSGRKGACAKAVLDTAALGQWWRRSRRALPDAPPTYVRETYGIITFGVLDATMLSQLEQRYGRERFGSFWRSSQPVEPAFEAAFGVSLDDYVRGWARSVYGVEPIGPRMSLLTVLLSLLTVGALLGIALRIVQRRAVH